MENKNLENLANDFLETNIKLKQFNPQQKIDESSKGESFCLLYLKEIMQEASPNELSCEMRISTARVAVILNTLEKKGFITREINKEDRRKIIIKLTSKGNKEAEKYKDDVIGEIIKMFKLIGLKDSKELIRITDKIKNILEKEGEIC